MAFRDSVWDDSEPEYAPGMKKIRNGFYWVPPAKYKKLGYAIKQIKLEGTEGDDLTLDRARHCRELTREMLRWYDGETHGRQEGTWGWLIARYKTDEYSAFHDVGASTREGYRKWLDRIEVAVGDVKISETDYPRMMMWQRSMRDKGRSTSFIKKWFTHWGLALAHGVKLGDADCARIKGIRSAMRIQNAPARSSFITREQVNAIVAEADRTGARHVALSLLFRFEFMLRGVDVYGEWEPAEGRQGGIHDHGKIWVKGLTWEMFDPDVTRFTKVISKTAKSLPEPYAFDLTNVPSLRRRLLETPMDERVGPVIVLDHGKPPKAGVISRGFKKIVRDLGLPDDLRISDARSGGITEAKSMVDPLTLRDAAQHTQMGTTDRYVRNRSDAANKVVAIRGGKK